MVNLKLYRTKLEEIRQKARKNDIPEVEIDKMLENSFRILEMRKTQRSTSHCIELTIIILLIIIVCLIFFDLRFISIMIMRNLQNSIYPGLNLLRKIAVPVVRHYPSLSEFYYEWCILENPYFYVNDIDCWPCSLVNFVPDLTGHSISRSFNPGMPYTKTENFSEIHLKHLKRLFWDNYDTFDRDAMKIYSNNVTYKHIKDVMKSKIDSYPSHNLDDHVTWRVNRMTAGRVLRKLFPVPVDTPAWWEQSTEKFVIIDEPKSLPYALPNPECSNVAIRCTSGSRLIKMVASLECTGSCASFTILLTAGKILWYNWWYWRPVSLPASNSTSISINYIISFC